MTILTEKQITKLKKMLIEQKSALKGDDNEDEVIVRESLRDSTDELSTLDNHPADLATELYEREKDMALKVHSDDELAQVKAALEKIENGTYGVCAECHEDIPYDRLRAIPYTAFCIEHTEARSVPTDRPVEEQVILPPLDNSFAGRDKEDGIHDYEDSFQTVAQYGTSETPSDLKGDFDDYNELYDNEKEVEKFSSLEGLHVSKDEFLNGQISQQYADEARKYDYLEE
ncbi:TraR/DksA C4-type zinc finger protein [Solibacillus sp. FSL H8-0538]|uniref:TraR/DksA C4-type zinc finger protein n=1 Tax=Solibacillus sp. FSL H8-0538 TaxID=2921400 RepID=UPI0030FC8F92